MKKSLLIFVLISLCVNSFAQDGILFEKSKKWDELKAMAKASGKLIFLDAYASWCGPCKWMAKQTFTQKDVGNYFNSQFINAKIDMEVGEGVLIASTYKVDAYPTLLFIDGNGKQVHRVVGALEAAELLDAAKVAKDPSRRSVSLIDDYEKGNLAPSKYIDLVKMLEAENNQDKAREVAKKVLQKNKNWLAQPQLQLLVSYTDDFESEEFQFILRNESTIAKEYGEAEVNKYLDEFVGNYALKKTLNKQTKYLDIESAKDLLLKYRPARVETIIPTILLEALKGQKDNVIFEKNATTFSKYAGDCTWEQLNSLAWYCFENISGKAASEIALDWALLSVNKDSNFFNNDTVANLYAKLKNNSMAKAYAENALKLGDAAGEDTSPTKKLLESL